MSLVFLEGNKCDIDADDFTCNGYYVIICFPSTYTLKGHLGIYGQVISSGEMVCEGTYFFPTNINYHYYV